jgi:hypothetical protein
VTPPTSLDEFFTPPNTVDASRLEGTLRELVGGLAARIESNVRTVLPARVDGTTRWYGLAPSDREARLLREELRCWLGPPISLQTSEVQNSSDPLDQAAQALVPDGVVLRIDVVDGWQAQARNNVASLSDVWILAPPRGIDQPRPVGRVLRQFYESLLAADRVLAEGALDEIKARALLNATNVRFLRVELLSSLGTPQEVRDDPLLRGISLLVRPPAVTERLAAAADALLVAPSSGTSAATAWKEVAQELEEAWPLLVTHPEQVTTLQTARCFAIRESLSSEPRAALGQVARLFPNDPVLRTLVPSAVPTPAPTQLHTAVGLYHDGDYWAALSAAESQEPVRATASVALAAAVNIGDSASAVRALGLVEALPADDRAQLLESAVERTFLDQLIARTSAARIPASWLDWLTNDWADRPDLLAEWASTWQRADVADDAGTFAVELLDAMNDARRGRVRNGLPVVIEWLVADGLPPSGVTLATTIFDILLSSEPGRTERQVSLLLLEHVLLVGCTREEYIELIEAVSRQLPSLGARDASWLAECVDLFMLLATPDPVRRDLLLADAAGAATAWLERLEPSDLSVLRQVFGDAGVPFAAAVPSPDTPAADVSGDIRSVGIYSLLEGAARVASERIRAMLPNVDVRISSGHVNSETLTALVRGADVMLVQTSHAKHAATQAINAAASDPERVVLVHGRGATALVRALLNWIRGTAPSA